MLNIIVCLENPIERKTIGLLRSIHAHVSYPTGLRIHAVAPRKEFRPGLAAIEAATELGAIYIPIDLNTAFTYYPLANKPLACAYVEQAFPDEEYLFLDSDTLFLRETDLGCLTDNQLGLRAVDGTNIGTSSYEGKNGPYWKAIHRLAGLEATRMVRPSNGEPEIFEYYNSGFIYSRIAGLFARWKEIFTHAMASAYRPDDGIFFTEQSCFAAAVTSMAKTPPSLPVDLNYPIHSHMNNRLHNDVRIDDADNLRHIHYHTFLDEQEQMGEVLERMGLASREHEIRRFLEWT